MKCHLCGEELTWDNIYVWRLNDRSLREYGCRNRKCRVPTSVSTESSTFLHIIMPDEEINYYLVRFPIRDKWYQVAASCDNSIAGTTFSVFDSGATYNPLFELPRFIPLDWQKPLDEQVEVLKDKLKTFLPFL